MYSIIEDYSPFFLKFTFSDINTFISYIKSIPNNHYTRSDQGGYIHANLITSDVEPVLNMLPLSKQFNFKKDRVAMFETLPRGGCGIHKDGTKRKVSFNIPIEIYDEKCVTKWYEDKIFSDRKIIGSPYTRSVVTDYNKIQHIPHIMQTVAKVGEVILFNTDIYHSFDNTESDNWRKILTLRTVDDDIDFFQAKKILFNH